VAMHKAARESATATRFIMILNRGWRPAKEDDKKCHDGRHN